MKKEFFGSKENTGQPIHFCATLPINRFRKNVAFVTCVYFMFNIVEGGVFVRKKNRTIKRFKKNILIVVEILVVHGETQ